MRRLTYFLRWVNVFLILLTFISYLSPFVSPDTFWPLAFFGVIYPWLLLANLLFVMVWLSMRRIYFVFSLGCILMGYNHLVSLIGFHTPASSSGEKAGLTVMSYNVHMLRDARQKNEFADPAELGKLLEKVRPDVLLLQEFPDLRRTPGEDAAAYIREETDLKYQYAGPQAGLVMFSTFPLHNGQTVYVNAVNGYQYADLMLPGGPVRIYNLHLYTNAISRIADRVAAEGNLQERETWLDIKGMLSRYKNSTRRRAGQAKAIAAHLRATARPVILGGDFNDIPQSFTYQVLAADLKDAFKERGFGLGATYAGNIPGLRIDYVLVSPQFRVLDYQTGARSFSDHRPVWARLEISPPD